MKNLSILFLVCFIGCKNPNLAYIRQISAIKDSLSILTTQNRELGFKMLKLDDSIMYLNSCVVMTKKKHDKIINYDRLSKYYRICKNNPSQWVFYKGWSVRVFEQ